MMFTIGVDLASGEKSSLDLFQVVMRFCEEQPSIKIIAFLESNLKPTIEKEYLSIFDNLEVNYCSSVITMNDVPSKSLIHRKADSSMVKGLQLLKNKKIHCFFSPGNTGSLLVLVREIVGLSKGVSFPSIGVFVPRYDGEVLLLDMGADLGIDEIRGLELAIMGKTLFEAVYPHKTAKISILNVGSEHYKGTLWIHRLNRVLLEKYAQNYQGFSEGFDIFTGESNVFITSGYTGNILLKSWEGFFSYLSLVLEDELKIKEKDVLLQFLKDHFHYSRLGTGRILGVKESVYIGHGRTGKVALYNALYYIMKSEMQVESPMKNLINYKKMFSSIFKRGKKR
jgi:glycerol-3-phosphate acyltransferase PlsX